MPMEPRTRRVVNQRRRTPLLCTDGALGGYVREPWILAAAQGLNLRREFQALNGGKDCGINQASENAPRRITERHSRRGWCREEPQLEEPYALIGHVRFCEERRP
jgi:hypothetical protein